MYDLIIIGLGPAGMNASIYAANSGLKTLAIEKKVPGGLLLNIGEVNNLLGFEKINGPELALKMFEHFNSFNIPYVIEEVMEIINENDYKIIKTNKNVYKTKNVLITSGIKRKTINSIDEFIGKGVSYCVTCDAALYKNKDVAIIIKEDSEFEINYLKSIVNNLKVINIDETKIEIEKDKKFIITTDKEKIIVDGIVISKTCGELGCFAGTLEPAVLRCLIQKPNNPAGKE